MGGTNHFLVEDSVQRVFPPLAHAAGKPANKVNHVSFDSEVGLGRIRTVGTSVSAQYLDGPMGSGL